MSDLLKKRKQIVPPLDYKLSEPVFVDDEQAVRDLCNGLVDDPKWSEHCNNDPISELLKMLKENGFKIISVKEK